MVVGGLRWWGSGRLLALSLILLGSGLTLVYYWRRSEVNGAERGLVSLGPAHIIDQEPEQLVAQDYSLGIGLDSPEQAATSAREPRLTRSCPNLPLARADVDTLEQFNKFDFQPYWMRSREYWDNNFETRYKIRKQAWSKLPLKVIVIPHSHNDPGWLKTFESYYHYQTRNILNNMADKLNVFANMTFIWSEISFFSQWWQSAHPTKRRVVQKLLQDGRLEITTGGWVMTDEATSHLYAMLDQLIEGHQWLTNNVGVVPEAGWSIDPFGHGATVPYLLKEAGFSQGTVIQRIHYAWKQWLADKQMGDFIWRQNWDSNGVSDMLVHNQPFDIYSIKHSCGPHPQVCINFDFRKIAGEYTEYSLRAVAIDSENVKQKAELLLEQYGRTGSLFPHNVVLMPVGDDFRYDHDIEWDQQYRNYKLLFEYINSNKHLYNAEVTFGTVSDYFKAVKEREREFKVLKGDFFVYSDIFSEGRPAYWSGYFTTRPYWKALDRELEAGLRSAEILYTLALNRVRRMGFNSTVKILERDYEKLSRARQNLALFQHHDAITGTSKSLVMHDYALKMFYALHESVSIQGYAIQTLLTKPESLERYPNSVRFVLPDIDREGYEKLPEKIPIVIEPEKPRKVVLFNSLAQIRYECVRVRVSDPQVRVTDSKGAPVVFQINPVWNLTEPSLRQQVRGDDPRSAPNINISSSSYELVFLVALPPLSLSTFSIEAASANEQHAKTVVFCRHCNKNPNFDMKNTPMGDVQLENHKLKLLLDGRTGFLKSVTDKETGKIAQCALQFLAYPSAQFHSGAYLFMPDPNAREAERDVLEDYPGPRIIIESGQVSSRLTVVYGNFLQHSIEIYHASAYLGEGIYVENYVDFEIPPKNRETELFMRIVSDVNNGDPPEFYADLNGFQTQKRVKVERIGIEGNYYPITTHAYIEDQERRLTLLVNHAHGAAAWQPGWLEVMLERRTLYDDSRGMGEGVVDNKRTLSKFWILNEIITSESGYSRPSLLANHLSLGLNYPPSLFLLDSPVEEVKGSEPSVYSSLRFLNKPFPCDVHLLNLRTLADQHLNQFPGNSALMILHRQGYSCSSHTSIKDCPVADSDRVFSHASPFRNLPVSITKTTLTGLKSAGKLSSLAELSLAPMHLLTLNVTFRAR